MSLETHAERAPFPIVCVLRDGRVTWANAAAQPLLDAWEVRVGDPLPYEAAERVEHAATTGLDTVLDQTLAGRRWELTLCPNDIGDRVRIYAQDRSREAEAEALLLVADRAPALSPDPILRVLSDGLIAWANSAAAPILALWGVRRGERAPRSWCRTVATVHLDREGRTEVLEHPGGVWAVRLVPDLDGSSVFLFASHRERPTAGADTSQDNFVANMGHELRTPLNAVVGYAELVQDELASRGMDQSVADLEKVRRSAARLRALIDDMVDLAKLQAGRIALEPAPFYIADLVDDVVVQAASKAEKTGNALTASVEVDPVDMRADPRRLRQVLAALLDNACKFTEHGSISVEVTNHGSDVAFRVIDTGIGLSAEQLAGLFRPYAQGDASATRKYGGTGLGLAIARMLARRMGGDVTVQSQQGRGSEFTLTLPREAPR